jgi:hypothetical protein
MQYYIDKDDFEYLDKFIFKILIFKSIDFVEFKKSYVHDYLLKLNEKLNIFNKKPKNIKYKLFYHLRNIILEKNIDCNLINRVQNIIIGRKNYLYDISKIDLEFYKAWSYYFIAHLQNDINKKIELFKLTTKFNYSSKYLAYWQLGKIYNGNINYEKYYHKKSIKNNLLLFPPFHLVNIYSEKKYKNKYYLKFINKKIKNLYNLSNDRQSKMTCHYILKKKINVKIFLIQYLIYFILIK